MSQEDLRQRPNTGVPLTHLRPDVVLCCGEDREELLDAVMAAFPPNTQQPQSHRYRCYEFWPFPAFTLAWTGIGTGCLEPWIKEVLEAGVVRRLVLIGTAGFIGDNREAFGKVYLVDKAYAAACAVERRPEDGPLTPRFDNLDGMDLPRGTTMSTDYYYGYSRRDTPYVARAQAADARLRAAVQQHWQPGRLIEMETAQFYHLCDVYDLTGGLQFVTLRGVANLADRFEDQSNYSHAVLKEAFHQAQALLLQA